ncbi:tol-pal system YbgF family protein, partial [Runella sp.]|uniref:tetratricopeptide repeat protein n=1 Tax=Runella sp. TaxID=1960881 RepID=UPI0026262504
MEGKSTVLKMGSFPATGSRPRGQANSPTGQGCKGSLRSPSTPAVVGNLKKYILMNLDELFKNGLTSLEKGDYDNGAKYFRECGELSKVNGNDQNAAYSFIKEAECHMKNERYIEANHILKIFSKYYKNVSSETGEFLYLYGLNCIHIGFVDKGIALLKQSSQVLSHIPNKTTHSDNLLDNASYVLNDAVKLDYGQAKDSKWLWLRKHLWNSNGNNFFLLLPVIAFMA